MDPSRQLNCCQRPTTQESLSRPLEEGKRILLSQPLEVVLRRVKESVQGQC